MRLLILTLLALLTLSAQAIETDGLVSHPSQWSPQETLERLEQSIEHGKLIRFNRIDHAAGAKKIGVNLRHTTVVIFGHPKGGTPLLQCQQTLGIDLPLKALVWEDSSGQVWLSYNDPVYLARRHGAGQCEAAARLRKKLETLIKSALTP